MLTCSAVCSSFRGCSYQDKGGGPRGGRDAGRDPSNRVASPVGSPSASERPKLALKPRSADGAAAADGASPAKANPFGGAKANDASKARPYLFACSGLLVIC